MATIPIVNIKDQRIGLTAAILFLLIGGIALYLMKYTVADPPPKPFVQPAVMDLKTTEIKNLKIEGGSAGAGTPSDAPVDPKPKPQTEHVVTTPKDSKTSSVTGQSSTKNNQTTNNPRTTTQEAPNYFGSGGQSSEGGGSGKFGKDKTQAGTGGGSEDGNGPGTERKRLNDPKVDDISSSENHEIHLRLTINEDGVVVDAKNIASLTTTVDQRIINQVIAAVKTQVRYNKKPGAELARVFLTVNINAN